MVGLVKLLKFSAEEATVLSTIRKSMLREECCFCCFWKFSIASLCIVLEECRGTAPGKKAARAGVFFETDVTRLGMSKIGRHYF